MLDVIKMSRWLPIKTLQERAKKETLEVATRWDVPQGPDVPEDLRDTASRYFRTAPDAEGRQGRVASRMLAEDLLLGSWSPAIPLLFALIPIITVLSLIISKVLMILALPVLIFIATSTERWQNALVAAFLGIALPAVGVATLAGRGMLSMMPGGTMGVMLAGSGGMSKLLIPVAAIGLLIFLFAGLRGARKAVGWLLAIAVTFFIASMLPGPLRVLVLSLPGAALPAAWAITQAMERTHRLEWQGKVAGFESSSKALSHIEGRKQQTERAVKDESPLITYGTSMGVLTREWDGYAPDVGLPMRLSVEDLSTHMLILGSTGSGKTSTWIRPTLAQWVRAYAAGALIMDGKGSLALDFKKLKGYQLIDPALCKVGLYEGMSSAEVSRTLRELNALDQSAGDARMWNDLAYNLCRHSATVLEALVHIQDEKTGKVWSWTAHDHYRLAVYGLGGTDEDANAIKSYLDLIRDNHPLGDTGLLADARQYFLTELPAQPPNVRGSIGTTFDSWITPLFGHAELLEWAKSETGVKVEDCLLGKVIGVNLPETRFGRAGQIAASFLKNRVYNSIRKRAELGDWRKADPEAKPVLIVMDEAQLLIGEADHEIAPIGRSLGCRMLICSQTIESLRATSKNRDKVEAFLDSFQSFAALRTSAESIEWIQKRVGDAWKPSFSMPSMGIDFVGTASAAAGSPLFDPNHPNARGMRWLLRRGHGGVKDIMAKSQDREHARKNGMDGFGLRTTLTAQGQPGGWQEKPLISKASFSSYTAAQGVAFVSLMRAGQPRRDFIRLDQAMFDLPDDLVDPDYQEPVQKNPEQKNEEIAA